jgi:hypothetical protein
MMLRRFCLLLVVVLAVAPAVASCAARKPTPGKINVSIEEDKAIVAALNRQSEAEALKAWEARFVRPCVRVHKRMTC